MVRAVTPRRHLTGTHFFQRERCRRFVWLEFHGDATKKAPPDPLTAMQLARGRAFEQSVIEKLDVAEPKYPRGDFEKGARATEELMRSRAPLIYQGVLAGESRVGIPDLLRWSDATQQYTVGDVKASPVAKIEHAMQVSFYSDLLSQHQQKPETAFLLLPGGEETTISLADVEPLYREAEADAERIRSGEEEPRAAFAPLCLGCAWRNICIPAMQQKRDLSLVHGVTPSRRRALEEAGVADAAALAVADLGALAARTELPRETLRRLRIQAESLADGAPRALGKPLWRAARIAWAAAAARDPRGTHISEFMLYRTAKAGDRLEESWHHAHAAEPADEERAYRKMLHSLRDDRDAPIYHYGPGFPDSLAALDAKYGKAGDGLNAIFDRLSDVQSALRSALVLPVHSYDLETVARNLGIDVEPLKPGDASAALRRRLASEVKSIRAVRVAAQRAWERAQLLQSAHPAQTQDSAVAGATQSRGAEEPAIGATPP